MKALYFPVAITLLLLTSCVKPKACFSADKTSALVNEEITFTNCSENTHHVEWDFGDGNAVPFGNERKHKYDHAGVYSVKLTAHFYEDHKKPDHKIITVTIY